MTLDSALLSCRTSVFYTLRLHPRTCKNFFSRTSLAKAETVPLHNPSKYRHRNPSSPLRDRKEKPKAQRGPEGFVLARGDRKPWAPEGGAPGRVFSGLGFGISLVKV